jgi:hypothetical protein
MCRMMVNQEMFVSGIGVQANGARAQCSVSRRNETP